MNLFKNLFVSKEVVELRERVDRLERIVKYAKDDRPSFRIESKCTGCNYDSHRFYYKDILYLYINKEEYSFDISTILNGNGVLMKNSTIEVEDDLAYVDLWVCGGSDYIKMITIDYKNDSWVCGKRPKYSDNMKKYNGLCASTVTMDESHEEKENEP